MNKLKYLATFAAGAGFGYFFAKRYYLNRLDDILADYDDLEAEYNEIRDRKEEEEGVEETPEPSEDIIIEQREDHSNIVLDQQRKDYNDIILEQKYDTMPKKVRKLIDHPFEIEETEYGTVYDYNLVNLSYYSDGVLTDEYDNEVDDVQEIVGDVLETSDLIPYNDIYVRNDAKRCDYKIFIDPMTFERVCEQAQIEKEYSGE